MRVTGKLTGPPPCKVCGSEEHGHMQLDPFTSACPLGLVIPDAMKGVVERDEKGEVTVTLELKDRPR